MLHSIKQTAIQITAVAVLTAGVFGSFATSAGAAPADRTWYAAPSDEQACLSSPASLNHTFCKDTGGGE
jgi:hypothetical protein